MTGRDTPWDALIDRLAAGEASLAGLWGEPGRVHLAALDAGGLVHLARLSPYPAVSARHPPALRLERAARDLHGIEPVGLPDPRPWLRHGPDPGAYPFLPVEGEGLHQIPVGPVHAGIIEPGHFRFTCDGETVVRLEQRLGYTHRGVEALMEGATLDTAARIAGRIGGDSTVACALGFARAAEAAAGHTPPKRAVWLRALAAELERLANHLGDVGAICNDAAFGLMHAHCAALREQVLRAAALCCGHRLMMDWVIPGGMATDLPPEAPPRLLALIGLIETRFRRLVRLYDGTVSLQDRTVGTGIVAPALAAQYGAGGFVGRASGRDFDARRWPGYPPYDQLALEIPLRAAGDVNARVWIRIEEIFIGLRLIADILDRLPDGPVHDPLSEAHAEGIALIEGFRGDILAWVRLDGAHVARAHLRDPSWFQWPLLEAAIEGNIVADFPLCNKSFNCSYAGHDL